LRLQRSQKRLHVEPRSKRSKDNEIRPEVTQQVSDFAHVGFARDEAELIKHVGQKHRPVSFFSRPRKHVVEWASVRIEQSRPNARCRNRRSWFRPSPKFSLRQFSEPHKTFLQRGSYTSRRKIIRELVPQLTGRLHHF